MPRFVKYKLTASISNVPYDVIFLAPPGHYVGDVGGLASVVAVEADSVADQLPVTKVEEILKSSLGTRRKLRINTGTEANPVTKYASIVIAQDQAAAFEAGVEGKQYKGGVITGIVESLDAVFY